MELKNAHVIVMHSAYGLNAPVRRFAERLATFGSRVETPDLYDGATADGSVENAIALRDSIGVEELLRRVVEQVAPISNAETVMIGFSMGAALAHYASLRGVSAKALVLIANMSPFDATLPVPASVHISNRDPWLLPDLPTIEKVCSERNDVDLYVNDGTHHLPMLEGSLDYAPAIASLFWERLERFMLRVSSLK